MKKVKDDSNNVLETYTYGAGREKLIVVTSTTTNYYVWGGNSIVCEYVLGKSSPSYKKSYIYAGSRLLMTATKATATTETKEFHHPDRLGTKVVTNGDTGSSYRQSTLPFGTALGAESTGYSNQVFTSYDRSSGTGLDYATNRTYSQGQSRFTQPDPIGMASASLGNPQSNNLYAYTQNMPTDFIDPSGLLLIAFCTPDYYDERTATVYAGHCYYMNIGGSSPGSGFTPHSFDPLGDGPTSDPKKFKADFYKKYGDKLNDCIKDKFGKDASKVPTQSLANAPDINDSRYTTAELGKMSVVPTVSAAGLPAPTLGTNGTVFFGSDRWKGVDFSLEGNMESMSGGGLRNVCS